MKKLFLTNSLGFQLFFGILGMFFILIFSTAYILLSTIKMQELVDKSFQQERFIKSIQESLLEYQGPLNQYLATRSSDALAEHLIISQKLRNSLPHIDSPPLAKSELREKEVYALIRAYLNLADRAVEQKRGRNTSGFALLYEEMTDLLEYIQAEIASISVERFQSQLGIYSQHIENSRNLQLRNFLFVLSSSLLAILLVLRSLQKITRPMSSLSTMAKELASGNFEQEDISASSIYEIDQVVEAFNRMKTEIHQSIIEIHHQENIKQDYMRERVKNFRMVALLRRMEIYTLQAQMNPHFLFNTLNTGMQLAILEKADRTEEFMDQLSKLLRHNVGNKESFVSLRHEITGLQYYFYLLRVRFPQNLDLLLDCPEELLDICQVPAAILQPLVENCVIHAFKNLSGQASIIVRAEMQDTILQLSVSDNGCGMDSDQIIRLLNPPQDGESSARAMGLENVIHRLYFYYPENREVIRIDSVLGQGTSILIHIDTGRAPCTES